MKNSRPAKQTLLHLAAIGAFALAAMASAFYHGVASGNDFAQHYQFAHTIHQSLASGEVYPSWAGELNEGYGDAAIRFYPPLAYYALSAAHLVLGDWYNASLLTFFLIFWAGGAGAYLWAREGFSENQSLLAAALYVFAPYHLNQIYNNFLYAEFAASAVLPFCFLFVSRVCRRGSPADVLGLAVSFGLLILTHLPLTVISSLALFVYGVSLLRKDSLPQSALKLTTAVIAGVAASSFYWVRMITEMNWVKHSSEKYFSQTFDYRANFLFKPQNVLDFETDILSLWFADLMLLAMILIAIPSAVLFFRNRRALSRFEISLVLLLVISVLMTTPLSSPVWGALTFLQKVQFPWRWLGIVALFGAAFASAGIYRAAEEMNKRRGIFLPLGLGVILSFYAFMSAFVIKQAVYLPRENFNRQMEGIERAVSFDCWWTIWAKTEAFQIREKAIAANGEREVEIQSWKPTEKIVKVSAAGSPIASLSRDGLRLAVFYYPHWRAEVNGEPARIYETGDGSITVSLASGESTVRLYFQEPQSVKTASVISTFVWLLMLTGALGLQLKNARKDFGF